MRKPKPKYEETAKLVLDATQAEGVFLIVVGGNEGSGVISKMMANKKLNVPVMLRLLADEMESK